MQVMPEDVLSGFKTLWDASVIPAAVPGGLHHGRAPNDVSIPYATISVNEGNRETWSSSTYMAKFNVTLRVWGRAADSTMGVTSRELAMLFDQTTALTIPNANNLIHCRHEPGGLELAAEPRNAEEILKAERKWEVMVSAVRENF